MDKFKKIIFSIAILTLAGCAAKYEKYYTFDFPQAKNGKQCIAQCLKTKERCLNLCNNDRPLCNSNAIAQADAEYKSYLNRKLVQGGTISYDRNAFVDPLQCKKVSCDCEADYRACYRMCGGVVKVKKRCVANCPTEEVKNVSY